jgi:hypothetical protein
LNKKYESRFALSVDNPPFEPPSENASVIDNGSLLVNGQEMFWRFFCPNTTNIQPMNFGFSFEIWWKTPNVGISVVFNLTETDGESSIEKEYSTVDSHEEIIENSGGEFVQYSIWSNTTYFFVNETWASLGDESIDSRNLNLSLGIRHDTFFPVFEYSILRDTSGPSIQIIHPNYNSLKKELRINDSSISFEIYTNDSSGIDSITLIGHFLNQTTEEPDSMILWERGYEYNETVNGIVLIPPLIVEKYVSSNGSGGGIADLDYYSILSEIVVLDSFGQETRDFLTIIIDNPFVNTTTTTGTDSLFTPPLVLGTLSVVGIVVVVAWIKKR